MTSVTGRCHCGAILVRFTTGGRLSDLAVRACGCSFCARHGARNVTDPQGRLEIDVRDERSLRRYRFGLGTSDFFVCGTCGVYVAAVLEIEDRAFATLNINTLEPPPDDRFGEPVPVSYDREDRESRLARRRTRWTPTVVRVAPAA